MSSDTVDRAVLEDLAAASRILVDQGVFDAAGHVSMRHPGMPDRFLMSRSLAPALVTGRRHHGVRLSTASRSMRRGRKRLHRALSARRNLPCATGRDGDRAQPFGGGDPVRPRRRRRCARCITTPRSSPPACRCSTSATNSAPPTSSSAARKGRGAGARRSATSPVALLRAHGIRRGRPEPAGRGISRDLHRGQRDECSIRRSALGGQIAALDEEEGRKADVVNVATVGRSWELWKRRVSGAP